MHIRLKCDEGPRSPHATVGTRRGRCCDEGTESTTVTVRANWQDDNIILVFRDACWDDAIRRVVKQSASRSCASGELRGTR